MLYYVVYSLATRQLHKMKKIPCQLLTAKRVTQLEAI